MISLKIRVGRVYFSFMNDVIVAGTITDQARVQVQVLCDDFNDFNKGLFVSCIGHMHEGFYSLLDLFKGPIPKRNQEAQVEDCSSPIEEDLKKLKMPRQQAGVTVLVSWRRGASLWVCYPFWFSETTNLVLFRF